MDLVNPQGRRGHFPGATSPLCPGMGEMVLQGEGCGGACLGAGVMLGDAAPLLAGLPTH